MSYNHNFSDANLNNLHTSMEYNQGGLPSIRTLTDNKSAGSMPWMLAVSLGLVPGVTADVSNNVVSPLAALALRSCAERYRRWRCQCGCRP